MLGRAAGVKLALPADASMHRASRQSWAVVPVASAVPASPLVVLAIKVRRSIGGIDAALQRDGCRAGLRDPQVLPIAAGRLGPSPSPICSGRPASAKGGFYPGPVRHCGRRSNLGVGTTRQATGRLVAHRPSGRAAVEPDDFGRRPVRGDTTRDRCGGDDADNDEPPTPPKRDRLIAKRIVIDGSPIVTDRPR